MGPTSQVYVSVFIPSLQKSCKMNVKSGKYCKISWIYIQGVSRLVDITAGGDFLGLCDLKSSYKQLSDFGQLRSYVSMKLEIEINDYLLTRKGTK